MSNSKDKKWFLVKKEWVENKGLSDEQFGMLIRALYCSSMPKDDLVKGMYMILKDEYARVNNFMLKDAQARSEKARKAAQSRWNNAKPMLEHANIDIDIDYKSIENKLIDKGLYYPSMKIPDGYTKEEYLNYLNQ